MQYLVFLYVFTISFFVICYFVCRTALSHISNLCVIMHLCIRLLFITVVCVSCTFGLYEDQIGKFDWRQEYIGKVSFLLYCTDIVYSHVYIHINLLIHSFFFFLFLKLKQLFTKTSLTNSKVLKNHII